MKKCTFIGRRDCTNIEPIIYSSVNTLLRQGVNEFYSGGMGNFDILCEKAVKKSGGIITYIPYNTKLIKERDRLWYDNIFCPFSDKTYSKYDIPNRNKWLVDNTDICLCYVYKEGGAMSTYDYALKKNKQIINLYYYI